MVMVQWWCSCWRWQQQSPIKLKIKKPKLASFLMYRYYKLKIDVTIERKTEKRKWARDGLPSPKMPYSRRRNIKVVYISFSMSKSHSGELPVAWCSSLDKVVDSKTRHRKWKEKRHFFGFLGNAISATPLSATFYPIVATNINNDNNCWGKYTTFFATFSGNCFDL